MDGQPPVAAPLPPAAVQRAAACELSLSNEQAQAALKAIAQSLPRTRFTAAWPSCLPGMVALRLADGSIAYTDKNARYLVVGVVFDTASGNALDRQMSAQSE